MSIQNESSLKKYYEELLGSVDKTVFSKIEEILTRVFGKDHFEIGKTYPQVKTWLKLSGVSLSNLITKEYRRRFLGGIPVVVHYDSVVVKNSAGQNRTMRDVFVQFSINKDGELTTALGGQYFGVMRTTLTPLEKEKGFSHVHGGAIGLFVGTCIGSGPLNKSYQGMGFKDTKFEAFLVSLKAHLEWENTEGGYHVLSTVKELGEELKKVNPSNILIKNLVKTLIRMDIKKLSRISYGIKGLEVAPKDEMEKAIGDLLQAGGNKDMVVFKTLAGKYYNYSSAKAGSVGKKKVFNFNNKEIFIKVKNEAQDAKERKEYYAHPTVTKLVCTELSRQIQKSAASKTIERKNPGASKSKAAKSNKALLPAG